MSGETVLNAMTLSTEAFVVHHEPLVKRIAYHLAGRLPSHISVQDMIQAGMIGLLEAKKHFEEGKGASFETFASIRIRGAMLDELRRGDWAPRSVHRAGREIAEIIRQIEQHTGQDAKDADIAKALEMTLAEYHQLLSDTMNVRVMAFDESGANEDTIARGLYANLVAPHDSVAKTRFRQDLAKEIAGLPERERLVIDMYYQEELTLKEIGTVLSVTESRVCQIHAAAILRLKARLGDWRA
ncbi:MAG: RNA polymerase sigma factor FliA [Gammaproteobacteria bacterium]